MVSYNTIHLLMPEILLVIAACWIYVVGAFLGRGRMIVWYAAVFGLGAAAVALLADVGADVAVFGPVGFDAFGNLLRWLTLISGFLIMFMLARREGQGPAPEVLGSLLLIIAGLMLVAASTELILLFLGLELITIPTYVVLFLGRESDQASQESTLKYFFLSILASAIMLYGFSFLYGLAGSTRLDQIRASLALSSEVAAPLASMAPLAFLLVLAGIGFKLAAVPFHFYAPDVYEGTSNINAGVLAVVPKIAGIVALVRILIAVSPSLSTLAWQACLIMALATMTLGNVVALWQTNIRRLMAYSSIAHAGYLLIGPAVWMAMPRESDGISHGVAAMLLYLVVYVLATLGTFAAVVVIEHGGSQINDVDELSGLGRTHRGVALALAIFMFSLAGIPPLAGFWGKLLLFTDSLSVDVTSASLGGLSTRGWFVALAIVGVLNAAISAAYYLRVVSVMYFRSPSKAVGGERRVGPALVTSFCAALIVGLGIYPGPLLQRITDTAASLEMPAEESLENVDAARRPILLSRDK